MILQQGLIGCIPAMTRRCRFRFMTRPPTEAASLLTAMIRYFVSYGSWQNRQIPAAQHSSVSERHARMLEVTTIHILFAPCFVADAGKNDHARQDLVLEIVLNLSLTATQSSCSCLMGQSITLQKVTEIGPRHCLSRQSLNAGRRHVYGAVTPCDRVAIVDNSSRAKQLGILSKRGIELVRIDKRRQIDNISPSSPASGDP